MGCRLSRGRAGLLAAGVAAVAVPAGLAVPDAPPAQPPPAVARPHAGITVQRDVRYATARGVGGWPVDLRLDIYAPARPAADRRPLVVWIHGGGFSRGDRRDRKMVDLSRAFARRGYVAASIDYRLMAPAGPVHDFPEGRLDAARTAADDARTAIRWLRAHARELGVDPRRIAVGGASAGAVTALLVATERPRLVRAAVSISGALPDERPFRRGDPPVLFFHGTADPLVPYDWALANATALRGERVPVVLDTLWQAGHVPWSRYRRRIVTESERFLDDVLDVTHPDRAPRRVPSWGLPPAEWMRLSPR